MWQPCSPPPMNFGVSAFCTRQKFESETSFRSGACTATPKMYARFRMTKLTGRRAPNVTHMGGNSPGAGFQALVSLGFKAQPCDEIRCCLQCVSDIPGYMIVTTIIRCTIWRSRRNHACFRILDLFQRILEGAYPQYDQLSSRLTRSCLKAPLAC